ncbi:cupin domain-containing protein [Legionella sp. CNM-1927-20]|uniref:cupin domain-containing protein n=1 Tax=Legionella sp. CNM-1927-20 TaxID=3422221 RepID=UPI00403A8337
MPNYIKLLNLESHQEGGYFGLFYKSSDKIIPFDERYQTIKSDNKTQGSIITERNAGSSIYFLLEKEEFSAWHRLKSDEIWHYYDGGSPIDIYVIDQDGLLKTYTLGNPGIVADASFQIVIKAGEWFAAEVRDKTSFGLVGCSVSPAFEYEDFELAQSHREELIELCSTIPTYIINKFINPNINKSNDNRQDHNVPFARNRLTAKEYIQKLKLERHQEGGYFCETYASRDIVMPQHVRYKDESTEVYRKASTAIYFLLDKQEFSAWHCLKSDEIWHYYDGGSPIDIYIIDNEGQLVTRTLGNPLLTEGASFQVIIEAGLWFAAEVRDKTSFGLIGCIVSPGFEYSDFSLAERDQLAEKYPEHTFIINKLTRVSQIKHSELAARKTLGFYASTKNNEVPNFVVDNSKIGFEI